VINALPTLHSMRQTPFVVLLLLRDFSVPSEQVCLLSDNLRALTTNIHSEQNSAGWPTL